MANNPSSQTQPATTQPHPTPEAEEIYRRWIRFLDEEFLRHRSPERRAEIVRDQLYQLYLGRPHGNRPAVTLTSELPGNVLGMSLDPDNVTSGSGILFRCRSRAFCGTEAAAVVLEDV